VVGGEHHEHRILQQRVNDELLIEVEGFALLGEDQGEVQFPRAQRGQQRRELSLPEGHLPPCWSLRTAAAPNGHVRGAVDPAVTTLRVVERTRCS